MTQRARAQSSPVCVDSCPLTASKQSEDSLRKSEDCSRIFFEYAPDAYFLHDLEGNFLDGNRKCEELSGYLREELIGRNFRELEAISPAYWPLLAGILARSAAGEATGPDEILLNRKGGGQVPVELVTYPVRIGERVLVLGISRDISERKRAEQEIERLAFFDALTGLPNRTLLLDRLMQSVAKADREGTRIGILFFDVDQFKKVNDTMGHAAGDLLLQAVAARLKARTRMGDTVTRLGGDEFAVVLSPIRSGENGALVAQQVLDELAAPFLVDGQEVFSSVSIGIAVFPEDGQSAETLLKNAELAMYQAKERGRNQYQFYSEEMNREVLEKVHLETAMQRALKREDGFFLLYQPQLDLLAGRITGVEALARWNHPEKGLVSPASFIPMAEETGLIGPLGDWVLGTACTAHRKLRECGLSPLKMAVNVSGQQLYRKNFLERIVQVLAETGMEPCSLEIELTESIFLAEKALTLKVLATLKDLGVRIAIDDFGTGFSSLSYLRTFPIDRIKIAQEFVRDIPHDQGAATIVKTVLAMARSLNMEVIAEGVETREQLEFLLASGCTNMQGYYFARPLDHKALFALLEDGLPGEGACPFSLR